MRDKHKTGVISVLIVISRKLHPWTKDPYYGHYLQLWNILTSLTNNKQLMSKTCNVTCPNIVLITFKHFLKKEAMSKYDLWHEWGAVEHYVWCLGISAVNSSWSELLGIHPGYNTLSITATQKIIFCDRVLPCLTVEHQFSFSTYLFPLNIKYLSS